MNENGTEITSINPGWIHKHIDKKFFEKDFIRIFVFFVINTPCTELSSSGISLNSYGWNKNLWKTNELKNTLFSVAGLIRDESFVVAKKVSEMKKACEKCKLKKNFHSDRLTERIVIYKSKDNEFLSICHHIRNSLAHGRFSIYEDANGETYVMEDGIKRADKYQVRARIVLKKSTIVRWIDIIEKGQLD